MSFFKTAVSQRLPWSIVVNNIILIEMTRDHPALRSAFMRDLLILVRSWLFFPFLFNMMYFGLFCQVVNTIKMATWRTGGRRTRLKGSWSCRRASSISTPTSLGTWPMDLMYSLPKVLPSPFYFQQTFHFNISCFFTHLLAASRRFHIFLLTDC